MLSKLMLIFALISVVNGRQTSCAVATAEDPVTPNFRYRDGAGPFEDYVYQLDEGKTVSTMFCHTFLGYQMFDFRLLDKHASEPPAAGLFEATSPGALPGFFEMSLC